MVNPRVEERVVALALGQRGVVTRAQLLAAGMNQSAIQRRCRTGQFHRLFAGVYRVGPVTDPLGWALAALLAAGRSARVSHVSAARLWGWLDGPPDLDRGEVVHVVVEGRNVSRRRGMRAHRVAPLAPDECAVVQEIPVTAPGRTLVDAATCLGVSKLEQVVARAQRGSLAPREALEDLLVRYRRRPGVAALRSVLRAGEEPALARSEAEAVFLRLARGAGLPAPRTNVAMGPYEVDFLWPQQKVVVEVDGFRFHRFRDRFEGDRRKDLWLESRGYQVLRVTWEQITRSSLATMVQVGQALALRVS